VEEEEESTHVRVKKEVLDRLRQFTVKKEGHLKYALYKEATKAIEEYVNRHTPLDAQQQHFSEQSLRSDVRARLDKAEELIRNDISEMERVKGSYLKDKLEQVTGLKDKRTLRKYLNELIFGRGVLDYEGRFQDIGNFGDERYLVCVGEEDDQ